MTAKMLIEQYGKSQIKLGAMSWSEFIALLDDLKALKSA